MVVENPKKEFAKIPLVRQVGVEKPAMEMCLVVNNTDDV